MVHVNHGTHNGQAPKFMFNFNTDMSKVFLSFLTCYRNRPVTIPLPFEGHSSSKFPQRDRPSLNVIYRSVTLPQRNPLFPTNISLNTSLVCQVGSR